jgi:hypothetical protein
LGQSRHSTILSRAAGGGEGEEVSNQRRPAGRRAEEREGVLLLTVLTLAREEARAEYVLDRADASLVRPLPLAVARSFSAAAGMMSISPSSGESKNERSSLELAATMDPGWVEYLLAIEASVSPPPTR